jgi:hypothetical protein
MNQDNKKITNSQNKKQSEEKSHRRHAKTSSKVLTTTNSYNQKLKQKILKNAVAIQP